MQVTAALLNVEAVEFRPRKIGGLKDQEPGGAVTGLSM